MRIYRARALVACAVVAVAAPGFWHIAAAGPPSGSGGGVTGGGGGAGGRVTICHRTHSPTNPYRKITVSISAVNGSSSRDHAHHAGAPFDAEFAYPPSARSWGDILPSRLNWTTAGQALYNGPGCVGRTAQEFYDIEIEAGESPTDVLDDLTEQEADEDDKVVLADLTYGGTDPRYLPPVEVLPVDENPVEQPPVDVPPVDETPVEEPPVEEPPVDVPPVDETPVEEPSVEEPPVDVPPVDVPAVDVPPVDETPVEQPPVEEPPVEQPPVEEPPVAVPAVDVPPVDETPVEQPPVEEPPVAVPPVDLPAVEVPSSGPAMRALAAFVWFDTNGDGSLTPGERGVPGIAVTLDGTTIGETGADGRLTTKATALHHLLRADVPSSLRIIATSDGRGRDVVDAVGDVDAVWWGVRSNGAGAAVVGLPTSGAGPTSSGRDKTPQGTVAERLPTTGAPVQNLTGSATLLLAAGTASVLIARRRRTEPN